MNLKNLQKLKSWFNYKASKNPVITENDWIFGIVSLFECDRCVSL